MPRPLVAECQVLLEGAIDPGDKQDRLLFDQAHEGRTSDRKLTSGLTCCVGTGPGALGIISRHGVTAQVLLGAPVIRVVILSLCRVPFVPV